MVVAAGDYVADNHRRASSGIYHIVMFGIQEKIVSYQWCRCALAPKVDVIIVTSLAREVTVLDQHIRISGMHALSDREKFTAPNVCRCFSGIILVIRNDGYGVSLGTGAFIGEVPEDAIFDIDMTCQGNHRLMVCSRPRLVIVLVLTLTVCVFDDAVREPAVCRLDEHNLFPRCAVTVASEMNRFGFGSLGEKLTVNNQFRRIFHQDHCSRLNFQYHIGGDDNSIFNDAGSRPRHIPDKLTAGVIRWWNIYDLNRAGIYNV